MLAENVACLDGMDLESNGAVASGAEEKLSSDSIKSLGADAKGRKVLKMLLRNTNIGLQDPIRKRLWLDLAMLAYPVNNIEDFDSQYDSMIIKKLPPFVDVSTMRFFALNSKARRQVATVLWNIAQLEIDERSCRVLAYPQIIYAPILYPLVSIFLHYYKPSDVYRCILALLSSRKIRFLGINQIDKPRDAYVLVKLTNKFKWFKGSGKFSYVRDKLKNNVLDVAYTEWIQWIFTCLPLHHCVRVIDCYLLEGEKFLYRVALELAFLFEKHHKKPVSLELMWDFCQHIDQLVSPSQLIANATSLSRFSRQDINKARTKAEKRFNSLATPQAPILSKNDIIPPKEYILSKRIGPRKFKSSVLSWNQLDAVWEWIPDRIYVAEPIVVFCSDENGNSLQTFYSLCGDNEPTILIVKTLNNEIFGAYCSAPWSKRFDSSTKVGQYFGNGETFLFSVAPNTIKYEWVGKNQDPSQLSHSQQLFMSATNHSFSVGGGDNIGLYLDENLSRGETNQCRTFNNKPLTCSDQTYFDVSVVEVIAFS